MAVVNSLEQYPLPGHKVKHVRFSMAMSNGFEVPQRAGQVDPSILESVYDNFVHLESGTVAFESGRRIASHTMRIPFDAENAKRLLDRGEVVVSKKTYLNEAGEVDRGPYYFMYFFLGEYDESDYIHEKVLTDGVYKLRKSS